MDDKRKNISMAAAVVACAITAGCASHAAQPPKPVRVVTPAPGATGSAASGERAIMPPRQNAEITAAQVRTFVLSHPIPQAVKATGITITSISFLPSEQVSALLHSARLDVPAKNPMCLVIMTGTFVFAGPPGTSPAFPTAIEVFDARTGNLMQAGGLPFRPRAG